MRIKFTQASLTRSDLKGARGGKAALTAHKVVIVSAAS